MSITRTMASAPLLLLLLVGGARAQAQNSAVTVAIDVDITLANSSASGTAQRWQLTSANAIRHLADLPWTGGGALADTGKLYVCDSTAATGLISHWFGKEFVDKFAQVCPSSIIQAYAAWVGQQHEWKYEGVPRKEAYNSEDNISRRASSFRYQLYPSFAKSKK